MTQPIKSILCRLFGHRYRFLRQITPSICEVKCERCKSEFGMNHTVRVLLPLDDELKQMHEEYLKS